MFVNLWSGGRPDRGRARDAEVVLEEAKVLGVDHAVPREVRAAVVPWLSHALAEGVLEDAEVARVHHVVVVAVARPHRAHLLVNRARGEDHRAGGGKEAGRGVRIGRAIRPFAAPVVSAGGQTA